MRLNDERYVIASSNAVMISVVLFVGAHMGSFSQFFSPESAIFVIVSAIFRKIITTTATFLLLNFMCVVLVNILVSFGGVLLSCYE